MPSQGKYVSKLKAFWVFTYHFSVSLNRNWTGFFFAVVAARGLVVLWVLSSEVSKAATPWGWHQGLFIMLSWFSLYWLALWNTLCHCRLSKSFLWVIMTQRQLLLLIKMYLMLLLWKRGMYIYKSKVLLFHITLRLFILCVCFFLQVSFSYIHQWDHLWSYRDASWSRGEVCLRRNQGYGHFSHWAIHLQVRTDCSVSDLVQASVSYLVYF